jgi:hypothetical protein
MVEGITQLIRPPGRDISDCTAITRLLPVSYYYRFPWRRPTGISSCSTRCWRPEVRRRGGGKLKAAGVSRLRFLCLVAAGRGAGDACCPPYRAGLRGGARSELNDRGYILPGSGMRATESLEHAETVRGSA